MLACHREGDEVPRERLLYLRQVCDQLAAALRGAALRSQNEQLRRFDPLTGLPNQRWLEQRIAERASAGAAERRSFLGLARVAIDGLDRVRATFGPGDVEGIVRRVGDRLRADGGESAVRLEGGEFGLLAEGAGIEEITRRLRSGCDAVRTTLAGEERAAYLHTRAGAAVWPQDASDAAGLLGCADAALRHAAPGSAGLVFYAGAMNEALEKRIRLESDLARAIERGELRLHYQPIVDARTAPDARRRGARPLAARHARAGAAARVHRPRRGDRASSIDRALGDPRGLPGAAPVAGRRAARAARLGERLAAARCDPSSLDEVLRELHAARIPPSLLALELTESSLLGEDPVIAATLESLTARASSSLVDDFGTGYSSLGYLKRFPVTRSSSIASSSRARRSSPTSARSWRPSSRWRARSASTSSPRASRPRSSCASCADRGCEAVQGYLFAKPLTEAVYRSWLAG